MNKEEAIRYIEKHISNPEHTQKIIELVQNRTLDPSEYLFMFREYNLFQEAASAGNLELMKFLSENKLVDVNLNTKRGDNLLKTLANEDFEIFQPVMKFLLEECGFDRIIDDNNSVSAAFVAGTNKNYLMERYLLSYEPKNSLGHKNHHLKMTALKFGLKDGASRGKKMIRDEGIPGGFLAFEFEGFTAEGAMIEIRQSFSEFIAHHISHIGLSVEDTRTYQNVHDILQKNTFNSLNNPTDDRIKRHSERAQSLSQKYSLGETIVICSESQAHAVTFVIRGSHFYVCNRGEGRDNEYAALEYTILNPQEVNANTLYELSVTLTPWNLLELKNNHDGLKAKDQYSGNCTIASTKVALHALIYHDIKTHRQNLSPDNQKALALKLYKTWSAWDRAKQVDDLIESCQDSPKILLALLDNILFTTARFADHHLELAKRLIKNIPTAVLEEAFKNKPHPLLILLSQINAINPLSEKIDFKDRFSRYNQLAKASQGWLPTTSVIPDEYRLFYLMAMGDHQGLKKILSENAQDSKDTFKTVNPLGSHSTCFMHAILLHETQSALLLLKAYPELAHQSNDNNSAPLHLAIGCGNIQLVEVLLKLGVDPDIKSGKNDERPTDLYLNHLRNFAPDCEPIASTIEEMLNEYREKSNRIKRTLR